MVIYLERAADLHMAQLMPLPLTVSASVKSRLVLPFWYRLTRVVPEKGPLNGCVCVCVVCNSVFSKFCDNAIITHCPHCPMAGVTSLCSASYCILTTWHCPACPHLPAAAEHHAAVNISCPPGPQRCTCSSGFAAMGPCWDKHIDTIPLHRLCSAHCGHCQ